MPDPSQDESCAPASPIGTPPNGEYASLGVPVDGCPHIDPEDETCGHPAAATPECWRLADGTTSDCPMLEPRCPLCSTLLEPYGGEPDMACSYCGFGGPGHDARMERVLDALGLEQVGWYDETVHMQHGARTGPTIGCCIAFAEEPHFDRCQPVYRLTRSDRGAE